MPIADEIRAKRPYPNNPQTSFDACEKDCVINLGPYENLTKEAVVSALMETAKCAQFANLEAHGIKRHNSNPSDFSLMIKQISEEAQLVFILVKSEGEETEEAIIRLYTYKEAIAPEETELRARSSLARRGITPEEIEKLFGE